MNTEDFKAFDMLPIKFLKNNLKSLSSSFLFCKDEPWVYTLPKLGGLCLVCLVATSLQVVGWWCDSLGMWWIIGDWTYGWTFIVRPIHWLGLGSILVNVGLVGWVLSFKASIAFALTDCCQKGFVPLPIVGSLVLLWGLDFVIFSSLNKMVS